MEKRGQLNWRESLHFITQIMRGLSHAHSRGIVHRDIKPQNIMVLRDGSVKVADFGIACLENSAQTLTQEALGSVHYISPEQARGDRTDARSDIYSAGVVLYEMLTGRLPFEGDSAVSVAIQHLSSIPLAPREINPDIPEQLELICMKAMSPTLDKRYASADAMIADLETFRKNPEVDLDFEMEDLRPEVIDEPTRPLRTASDHTPATHRPPPREREYRRDYDEYDDEPAPQKKTGQTVLIVIAVVLAAALAFVLIRSILGSFETPVVEEYKVQNVLGYTVEQAQEMNGVKDIFTINVAGEMPSDEYPKNTIAKQDPEADVYRRGEGLVINVWVSTGEDVGEMIDVTNKTVPEAKIMLKSLIDKYDLEVVAQDEDMQYSDKVTEGYIISSTPAANETLKKGDTIYLVVSKGPEILPVTVPNFVGRQMEEVRKELNTWKLTCTDADIELVDSDRPGGEIVWQSLDPESTAQEWDTIQFQVSSGLAAATKQFNVELPQDGRETVTVSVYVGSETTPQYNEVVSCSDIYAYVTLTGTGNQQVKVYIDGVLDQYQSQMMPFSE
jgi:serine/threonine-protein kinase